VRKESASDAKITQLYTAVMQLVNLAQFDRTDRNAFDRANMIRSA